jgi:hypothetical protein
MQQPNSPTKFLCWSLAINKISFLNSGSPCPEFAASLLTATSCPFGKFPWNIRAMSDFQHSKTFDNTTIPVLEIDSPPNNKKEINLIWCIFEFANRTTQLVCHAWITSGGCCNYGKFTGPLEKYMPNISMFFSI